MEINIEENSNCDFEGQYMFVENSKPKPVEWIMVYSGGKDLKCRVTGVYSGGVFGDAYAVSVDDSGEGTAYLIYGGEWGIRYQPVSSEEPWDLSNPAQSGDAYKIYSSADDIGFAGTTS